MAKQAPAFWGLSIKTLKRNSAFRSENDRFGAGQGRENANTIRRFLVATHVSIKEC